jgi:hypothetical protein
MKKRATRTKLVAKSSKPLGQIIAESVRGEHDGWPTDPQYSTKGSHEDRFNAGDKQRVLWQIYDCAVEGTPIPKWAAKAFCDALVAVVTCQSSWEREFGDVPAKGRAHRRLTYQTTIQKLAKHMIQVGEAIQYHYPKDDEMYEALGKRFGLDRNFLKECWRRYKLAHCLK